MRIFDILAFNARKHPDATALIVSGRSYTFAELGDRVNRLANALADVASAGDRVAILAENCGEYVEAYYGVPAAGMALAFLNYRLNPKEMANIAAHAEATVLLVQHKYLESMLALRDQMPTIKTWVVIGGEPGDGQVAYGDFINAADSSPPAADVDDDQLAWLLYTSGTTGLPKGVMLTHRNLVAGVLNSVIEWPIAPGDTFMHCFPLCHIAGYSVPLTHLLGNTCVLMEAYEPERFMQMVQEHKVTHTALAPTMVDFLLRRPDIDDYDLSSLQMIGYGAAPMPAEVLRAGLQKFGPVFMSGFGMTELAGNVLIFDRELHRRAAAGEENLLTTCGRRMVYSDVRLVDDDMNDVPVGQVGELVMRGDQVTSGYWRNDELREQAFAGGWFHSGDLGREDDEGNISIVDRKKDMIITGGENVYSREVEEVIYTVPGVVDVAVVGLPDTTWGENICAVVVTAEGAEVTADDVIGACRQSLAGYKKPKRVEFVDALPRNVAGKILKRELRDQFSGG
jgi:acyl-CoA synthetase (AMP-forming)/AMP-acid ligase II